MSEFAKILAEYGGWGLSAILLAGIVGLFRRYDNAKKEHLADVKESRNTIVAIKDTVEAQGTVLRAAAEQMLYVRQGVESLLQRKKD